MTERRCSIYLGKGLSVVTVGAFFYMLYLMLVCWNSVSESNELIAVKWCRNDDPDVHYADSIARHGLYVYLERLSGKIIIREMSYPLGGIFQSYRYAYSTIGHSNDVNLARASWGGIKCLEGNKAMIGSSGYVFSWGNSR